MTNPRARREGIGGLAVREPGLLRRVEPGGPAGLRKVRSGRLDAPGGRCVARADGRTPADRCETGGPLAPAVHAVPQACQDAAGCEDPGDLGSRDRHVEPVHGVALPAGTASTDASGSGIPSALPGRARTAGQRAAQLAEHRRVGLDGDGLGAQRDERGRGPAGSGAEVERARAGRGGGRAAQRPVHRRPCAVRTVLGVCDRRRAVEEPFVPVHAVTAAPPPVGRHPDGRDTSAQRPPSRPADRQTGTPGRTSRTGRPPRWRRPFLPPGEASGYHRGCISPEGTLPLPPRREPDVTPRRGTGERAGAHTDLGEYGWDPHQG